MTVYMRTGENSAVSFPLWFYAFAILPLQLLWLWAKLLVVLFAALAVATFFVGRWAWEAGWWAWERWRG